MTLTSSNLKGVANLADGKAFADPEVLRRLTSSVSSALDEAAAALTRMRMQNNGVPTSPNHTTDAGHLRISHLPYLTLVLLINNFVVAQYLLTISKHSLTYKETSQGGTLE